jgi:hypothetical protein
MTVTQLPALPAYYVEHLLALGRRLRAAIVAARSDGVGGESDIVRESGPGGAYQGDTIYRVDVRGEAALLEYCEGWAREQARPMTLVAEGLPNDGRLTLPAGADPNDAAVECIVDPIDGTRMLMYDKRSAWVLAAVAPGPTVLSRAPTLADVAVAAQVELPTSRARLADALWAVAGGGAHRECEDLASGETRRLPCRPSGAGTLAHGFATVSKFFPGTKQVASWIEERLFAEVVGEHAGGAPLVFDDEYLASGGQLYELLTGHDRFVADLRPAILAATRVPEACGAPAPAWSGARPLCARPYDLCTELIAREAGVVVTDEWGRPLAAPLDTVFDVSWVGYANEALRTLVEPVLQRLLRELGVPPPC